MSSLFRISIIICFRYAHPADLIPASRSGIGLGQFLEALAKFAGIGHSQRAGRPSTSSALVLIHSYPTLISAPLHDASHFITDRLLASNGMLTTCVPSCLQSTKSRCAASGSEGGHYTSGTLPFISTMERGLLMCCAARPSHEPGHLSPLPIALPVSTLTASTSTASAARGHIQSSTRDKGR